LPSERVMVLASLLNASVTMTTEGIPRRSREMASWTLHVVQDPQWPMPTMAASAFATSMLRVSSVMGLEM
jgi:hypothetical protein